MQIPTRFQLWEFLHFWLRYATLSGTILRVFWWSAQGLLELVLEWRRRWCKTRNFFYEPALHRDPRRFVGNRPANGRSKSFHFGGFASLTTLCGHYITCIVYRMKTWCTKKRPRISVATCFRTYHSGSLNVLNPWRCCLYSCHLWVEMSLRKISEPIDRCLRLRIDVKGWQEDDPSARTRREAVAATSKILHCWLHDARK